jgi:sterol desaturase/sphingolipid hydroxylase (fatty acid hydroxylase superfamily)
MSDLIQWILVFIKNNSKPLETAAIIIGAAWILEYLRPAVPDAGFNSRWHNLRMFLYLLIGLAIAAPLVNYCGKLLPGISLIERIVPNWKKDGLVGGILATIIYAFIGDFFQYWTHRLEHSIPLLWSFHRIHHSDANMNASTSLRQSLGGVLIGFFLAYIPTSIICGVNMVPYLGSLILFSGWGYFNHANFRLPLGPFTYIISGPQWHRLHHGKDIQHHNSNYSAFFPVFDLIFGTLQIPKKDQWVETGIHGDESPRTPFAQAYLAWLNRKGFFGKYL